MSSGDEIGFGVQPASIVNGTCGSDNGKTLSATPVNLCSTGTPSAVSGSGPWTWICNGANGGTHSSCSAQLQTALIGTTTALTLAPNPAGVNLPVAASVTINSATAASVAEAFAAAAGGSVIVSGGSANCTAAIINGAGSCTLFFAAAGAYPVTANYTGDATHAPSGASANEVVTAAVPGGIVPTPMLGRWALLLLAATLGGLAWRRCKRPTR